MRRSALLLLLVLIAAEDAPPTPPSAEDEAAVTEAEERREDWEDDPKRSVVVMVHGRSNEKKLFMGVSHNALDFTMLNSGSPVLETPKPPCAASLYSTGCLVEVDDDLGEPFLDRLEHYPFEEPAPSRSYFGLLTADSHAPMTLRHHTLRVDLDGSTAKWISHASIDVSKTFSVAIAIAKLQKLQPNHKSLLTTKWQNVCRHPGFYWLAERNAYLIWWTAPTAIAHDGCVDRGTNGRRERGRGSSAHAEREREERERWCARSPLFLGSSVWPPLPLTSLPSTLRSLFLLSPRLWAAWSRNLTRLDSDPWPMFSPPFSIGASAVFHARAAEAVHAESRHLLLFYTDEGGTAGGTVHKSLAGVVGSRIRIATEPVTMSDNELAPIVFQYDAMTEESLARFTTGARVISSGRDDAQLAANGGDWDAVITAPYVMYYACGTSGKESSFSGAIGISQSFDLLDWGAVRRPGHQACGQSHSIASSSTSFAHTTVGRRAKTRWPTVVRITQDELDVLEYEFPTTLERAETVVGIIMTSLALIGVFAFLAALCFVRLLGGRCGCGSSGSLASMRALAFLTDVSIVM